VQRLALVLTAFAAVLVAGCGGSSTQGSPPPATGSSAQPATTASAPAQTSTSAAPGALQGEPGALATGDIPDNQMFLRFQNAAAGYSMKYPEGWAQQGTGPLVTIRDKNNIIRIAVTSGTAPTAASVKSDLSSLKGAQITSGPTPITLAGAPAFKVVYSTESSPNPVTGKRVKLVVNRYYLSHGGKVAIVDLATPVGVDNVDAYRLMIESFRWR
jgi:hypothetical protein